MNGSGRVRLAGGVIALSFVAVACAGPGDSAPERTDPDIASRAAFETAVTEVLTSPVGAMAVQIDTFDDLTGEREKTWSTWISIYHRRHGSVVTHERGEQRWGARIFPDSQAFVSDDPSGCFEPSSTVPEVLSEAPAVLSDLLEGAEPRRFERLGEGRERVVATVPVESLLSLVDLDVLRLAHDASATEAIWFELDQGEIVSFDFLLAPLLDDAEGIDAIPDVETRERIDAERPVGYVSLRPFPDDPIPWEDIDWLAVPGSSCDAGTGGVATSL